MTPDDAALVAVQVAYADAKLRHMQRAQFLEAFGLHTVAESEIDAAVRLDAALAYEFLDPQPDGLPKREKA